MSTPVAPPPPNNRRRNRAMLITALIFLVLGAGWFAYWWIVGRFYEYTDDAYVDGNNVVITPQIDGIVESFSVLDADLVPKGRVVVELDKTDATIALEKAIANLGKAVREVMQMFEQAKHDLAMIEVKKAEFVKAAQDYEHRQNLIEEGGVSLENFEHAEAHLRASFADLIATEHQYIGSVSLVENTTVDTHPIVERAKTEVQGTYVVLQRCTIKSPVTGIVAQRTVQVGENVHQGQPLMAIVPLDQMWVNANYKEIQLSKMRVGQPVQIISDMYGDDVVYRGKVAGIGGGTGSVFSVLPPQNATGNWIKIVQRIPVRITLDEEFLAQHPLRLGLSMDVTVDLHDVNQPLLPEIRPDRPLYATDLFCTQEEGAEPLILRVIAENLSPTFIDNSGGGQE